MRRIAAHRVFTPDGMVDRAVVTVAGDGRVVAVEAFGNGARLDGEAGVEFYSGVLVPGLVNAHCHLELSHLRGLIPAGVGFGGFVDAMKKTRAQADANRRRPEVQVSPCGGSKGEPVASAEAEFWDARMWSEGVAAVADICNGTSTWELKKRSPIFYHSFREIFGAAAAVPADAYNLTPHSLYSLTPAMFAAAIGDGSISVHFRESEFEVEDPAAELVKRVPADTPVLLIHNCLCTQRDIDIVMGHFTAPVTWVLCPRSNRHISGLKPPTDLLRRNRLRIALGTDSLASNEVLSMAAEMAEMADVPLEEVLGWATLNGALALGLDHELGSIEVGKRPGLAVLNGGEIKRIL